MHSRNILPALALLAPLVSAQDNPDTPIVNAFLNYMENEGLSSLSAEGLTVQASLYSSVVDSIQGVLATAAPSDASFVESYVSSVVFADPTLSSVMVSITSEYGNDATPAAGGSSGSATETGSSGGIATPSASSGDAAHAVDARNMGVVSTAVGALILGFAVLL